MDELLVQVMALEDRRDSLIEILDSPILIPIPLPRGYQLIPIKELDPASDDNTAFAIMEDQAQQLEGEEAQELRVEGEVFEDGEMILDVLQRRNLRGDEVPEYKDPLEYNNPGYISNH